MRSREFSRQRLFGAFSSVARIAGVACVSLALLVPANAQFWGGWGAPQPQSQPARPQPARPSQQYQQQYSPFQGVFGGSQQQQQPRQEQRSGGEIQLDFSNAPKPQKRPDPGAATTVVVVGDSMADWLAYGLEDAFAERPEFSVVRKHRTYSGLIRYDQRRDNIEWAQAVKEAITADKPKVLVMMIGVNDRQQIRERTAAPAPRQPVQPTKPADPALAADPELQAQQSADQQNAQLQNGEPEPAESRGAQNNLGPFEFRTEKWEASYVRRIDATIAAMKAPGVTVYWVGLPSQRNVRASTDSTYLNDLYRQRAERAGINYIDVWDGFVDDAGRFTPQGPDFEGQTRRLRAGDGIYFTKPGARKLAHYVEREILRTLGNRAAPMVSLPAAEPAATPGARGGAAPGGATRPLAGPVVPLTVSAGGGDELLGAVRPSRPVTTPDPVAVRVLMRGEPIPAPSGRADDFRWPRGGGTPEPATEPVTASAPAAPAQPNTARASAARAAEAPRAAETSRATATPRAATTQQATATPSAAQPNTAQSNAAQSNAATTNVPHQAPAQRRAPVRTPAAEPPRQQGALRPQGSIPQPNYFRN